MKRGALLLAAACCVGALVAAPAGARVAHDPCGARHYAHVTAEGLHCGGVFEIPGHRTWHVPGSDQAPSCNRSNQEVAGVGPDWEFSGLAGDWDYWTRNGEWVVWNLSGHMPKGDHGQPVNVVPAFHNWGASPWQVRVFFRCGHYHGRGPV